MSVRKVTVATLAGLKARNEKAVFVTAYDYPTATFADRAGVDFTYISKVENDRLEHTPSVKTLQDLAQALGSDELELMALANKVPHALQAITQNREALRFFRRASKTITTPEGWHDLNAYLDRHDQPIPGPLQ